MMKRPLKPLSIRHRFARLSPKKRLGAIILLASGMMIMVFGFLAFTVDVGYISLTKAQLEAACDAGARAAVIELKDGLGTGKTKTPSEAQAAASQAAVSVVAANRAGDQASIYADPDRDIRFGQAVYDPDTGSWKKIWGASPATMVEVTLHRDDNGGGNGDGPLPLFFAPVIGTKTATLSTKAVSAMLPANGFRIPAGSSRHAMFLPFALDEYTWQDLLDKDTTNPSVIPDSYAYDPDTKSVCSGNDEIYEVDLYPYGHDDLPPGNRGTVDLGASNNSTSDLARQILYGLNADDLSHFPNNEVKASCSHPLPLNGDTGISAGMKDELQSIIGQPRCIPIFTQAVGNGNNCTYTIIKFVGVRVVDVKLTGNPKYVRVQPCPFSDENVTYDTSGAPINNETIFSKPVLIQ